MTNFLFIILAAIHLWIAIRGTQETRKHRSSYALLILIVVYGLVYDNFAIALGSFLGEGDLTKALNWPRYAIHALFTPGMIIAAFGQLRRGGVSFAQSKTGHIFICVLATALILLGTYTDILNLDLVAETSNDVTRYVNSFEFLPGPPIPAVLTILFVLVFGLVAWRKMKWPWLFIGALLMFGTAPLEGQLAIQNLGEIAFAASLVTTEIYAQGMKKSEAQ